MTHDLEERLTALSAALEVPPPPDVTPAVLARLRPRAARRRPSRRVVALALTLAVLLAAGALAAAPSRDAILRILGLRGVTVERVPRLPVLPGAATLGLGRRIPRHQARHAASFSALLPPGPATAYVSDDVPGGRIALQVGRALVIEFRGTTPPFIFKVVGPATRITPVRVNGGPGVYLDGAPHMVLFRTADGRVGTDRVRLAGNVLIWQQGALTVRIEGLRTLHEALSLARSLR